MPSITDIFVFSNQIYVMIKLIIFLKFLNQCFLLQNNINLLKKSHVCNVNNN